MSQQPLLEEIVRLVVSEPDVAAVKESRDRVGTLYTIRVAPNDVGRLIGRDGRVISCVRLLVSAVAAKHRQRASVKVVTE